MSNLSVNTQQRFSNLRKKLDQLGYLQPLSIESLPLVEHLFNDFVWTTDSFRKCKNELDKRMDIRDKLEDYIEPYKSDNGRHLNENNRLQKKIMEMKIEYEERMRDLHCQIRHLEEEKEDLKLFNEQCLEKLKKYEVEAKLMVDKIMHLQEKNVQAFVHIPEGKRKQIPFRRQRMDIEFLIPHTESCDSANDTIDDCRCGVSKDRSGLLTKQSDSCADDQLDLVESLTNKCQDLSHQLRCCRDQQELNERKLSNYSEQISIYEEEIERMTRELSGGRSIEALTLENRQRTRDRVREQLSMQIDLLTQRNEELEKELIRCNALNIQEGKSFGYKDKSSIQMDNESIQQIQNRKLLDRIDELVNREKCLLKELHCANARLMQRNDDCIPTITDSLEREIDVLQQHIQSLEADRNYWKKEAEIKNDFNRDSEKQILPNDSEESKVSFGNDIDQLKQELSHCRHRLKDVTAENNELKQMIDMEERHSSPPVKDKDHSRDYELELKKVRMERDSLQDLLNKFERQLHDIQGNIRVLTQERDMISERYEECQRELHQLREVIVQNDKSKKDSVFGTTNQSLSAQSLLRRLEMERDDAINDLHRMTTERDSLRERLRTVTETSISEKARICQRLEDYQNEICRLQEDKEELIEKASILRKKIGELEEHNHQLAKKNDSLGDVIEKERAVMQTLNSDIQRFQNEIVNKERKESQISEELKNTENRVSILQERLESNNLENSECKNEITHLKEIISDLDREKDQMQSEVDEKIEQLKETQKQLKVKEDALNEIRINMTSLEQQLRRINEVNNHRDQELRALVVHNEQLENDMRHQVSKYDQMKAENTRLEEDIMCLSREQRKLEAECRDSNRCIMEINQEKEQLEQQLSHFQKIGSEQKDQNEELLEQYRQLSLEYDTLQLNLQRLEGDNEELKVEIDARENMVSRMREQLLQAEQELNSTQSNVHHLEDQIRNLNQVLENNEQITENHSIEKHEILQELAAMRDLCSRLEHNKENIQRQLSSRLLDFEQLKSENNGLIKENENLREEIDSLNENIRNMETVLNVGREKEFMNELESQRRIAELESENEHLAQLPAQIDLIQHELKKHAMRCTEMEAECEKLRRQLTSEKFKLELANQELRRRQKINHCSDFVDRFENCITSDRPIDTEYYRTDSSLSENNMVITSTGFCTDISTESPLMCNHGCYHSKDCNNIIPLSEHGIKCGHGCRHSETCLEKKKLRTYENRRRRSGRRNYDICSDYNCNNHELMEIKNNEIKRGNPKCPLHKVSDRKNEESNSALKISDSSIINKKISLTKLPTIHSESDDKNNCSESVDTDEDRNSSILSTNKKSETVTDIKSIVIPKKVDERKLQTSLHVPEHQLYNVQQSNSIKDNTNNQLKMHVPKSSIDISNPMYMQVSITKRERILSAQPTHLQPIPLQASVLTNETVFSKVSRDTNSTKLAAATSTLALVPSLTGGVETKNNLSVVNAVDQTIIPTLTDLHIIDPDPTDVSESLSHSFYNISGGVDSNNLNSSSGVHTGRSVYTHTPTLTSSNNNNNTNVSDVDTRVPTDRTEVDNQTNLDDLSGS